VVGFLAVLAGVALGLGAGTVPDAPHRILVVGSIHGDEREGHEVIRRLRRMPSGDVAVRTVKTVNPDGVEARTRGNADGVDLNRNFPYRWRAAEPPGSAYYQGPRPASEPETRMTMRLIRRLEPEVTIWFHQPWHQVLAPCRGTAAAERLYARIAGTPLNRCRGQHLPGAATRWQEHRVGGTAFVVELGAGELSDADVRRHARAVTRVAQRFG
jgi:murein peptide amidase A